MNNQSRPQTRSAAVPSQHATAVRARRSSFRVPDSGFVIPDSCAPASSSRRTPRARLGFILLVVLVVIVMITLAGLSYVLTLSTENRAVRVQGDQLQLEQILASGVELLRAVCSARAAPQGLDERLDHDDALFRERSLTAEESGGDGMSFRIVSPEAAGETVAGWRFGVQNESARLNLAALLEWDRQEAGAAARALLHLPGMTEAQADAILDWIDADSTPRAAGAEAEYYTGRGLPYEPRNGVPAVLEELLLVRDVTRLAFCGDEGGPEGPPTAATAGSGTGGLPWARLLTVYSAERNATADGRPRIFLNQSDLARLHSQLREEFPPEWADFLIAFRQYGPAAADAAPGPPPPGPKPPRGPPAAPPPAPGGAEDDWAAAAGAPGPPRPGVKSPRGQPQDPGAAVDEAGRRPAIDLAVPAAHPIPSLLDLIGIRVALPRKTLAGTAPAEPFLLASPFESQPDWRRNELPRLLDLTTTMKDPVIYGRVNVREAPRCVLLGIPGMDSPLVDRIMAVRGTVAGDSESADRHALWLLDENLVDVPRMKALLNYVTGGGDVFRAQVVADHQRSRLSAQAEVVIDATAKPPRQVYYKERQWPPLTDRSPPEPADGTGARR